MPESPATADTAAPADAADLVRAAAAGDAAAWDAIVERFTPLLWSVARAHRLDRATAVDVAQLTWLRLLERIDTLREPAALPGWLATTARRECLAVLRRAGREQPGWDDDLADGPDVAAPALDALLLTTERDRVLWQAFGELTERCRRLLRVVVTVEAVSYAAVATALGLPVGSIGPTRMRCLARLRSLLEQSGYPFDGATPVTP